MLSWKVKNVKKALGYACVGCVIVGCIVAFFVLCSVHKLQSVEEVELLLSNMLLPKQGDRCKVVNSTHLRCLPNVFVIGASKCGTTSIVEYMKHMESSFHFVERGITDRMDNQSEIHRFDRNTFGMVNKQLDLEVEWASSPVVRRARDFVVHYTPHYLYAPTVPYELREFYPDPKQLKFIVLLREPLDRALSSYGFFHSTLFNKNYSGSAADFMKGASKEIATREAFEKCMIKQLRGQPLHLDSEDAGVAALAPPCVRLNVSYMNKFDVAARGVAVPKSVAIARSAGRDINSATTQNVELLYRYCAADSNPHDITSPVKTRMEVNRIARRRRDIVQRATEACFGGLLRSPKLGRRHIDKGVYVDQIGRWLTNFRREQFHFIATKDLAKQPALEMKKLIVFLGSGSGSGSAAGGGSSAPSDGLGGSVQSPHGFTEILPEGTTEEQRLEKIMEYQNLGHMVKQVNEIPFAGLRKLSKPNPLQSQIVDGLSPGDKNLLLQFYKPYNDLLQRLLNRTFWA